MAQGFTVNSVFLTGNLTRDPEVKFLKSGTAVASFGLAVNNRVKRGDEWVDDPCFIDITVFGKTAEQIGETIDKGMPVLVEGRLQYRTWEGQDGQKRSKHEVIADIVKPLVKFQGNGSKSSREPGSDDEGYERTHGGRQMPRRGEPTPDDDVPF
jgi:single-strand DNA-binding protein